MPPPNLAADTPILNVLEPLSVDLLPMRRKEADQMLADDAERFLGFRIMQKPLLAQTRLDRNTGALAEPDRALARFRF